MGDLRAILPELTEPEVAQLQACLMVDPAGRSTSLADLVSGWAAHVDRFERELALSWDDRAAWTEHDFLGALHLRERLARALEQAPVLEAELVDRVLARVDPRFEGFTEVDSGRLLARILPGDDPGSGWWWSRIPVKGPVREGLLRLRG